MKKIKKWLIIPIICILMICIGTKIIYTEQDAWNELLALDSSITMEDLTQEGYIDVSEVMSSENKEILSFFAKIEKGHSEVLRVANIIDGKLCAKILFYNTSINVIKMWTIYPNQQQAEDPGKCFSVEIYEVETDGVINVFLKHVPDATSPTAEKDIYVDEKLYSYLDNNKK